MPSEAWSEGHRGGSMWTAYVFTINVIFGSGVLAMPKALQQAGYGLGECLLLFITFVAWTTVMWCVEAICRLCYLNTLWSTKQLRADVPKGDDDSDALMTGHYDFGPSTVEYLQPLKRAPTGQDEEGGAPAARPARRETCLSEAGTQVTRSHVDDIRVGWELNELCIAFLGKKWAMAYDAMLCLYTWAVMWLYVTVWCEAFLLIIPLPNLTEFEECNFGAKDGQAIPKACTEGYYYFVLVFVILMSVLCVKDWKAFNKLQGLFTVYSYFCLVVMLTTIVIGLAHVPYAYDHEDPTKLASNRTEAPYIADAGQKGFDFGEFGMLFGCCIFSQMAHQGTAQILQAVPDKEKTGRLFAFAFATTFTFYTLLSVAAGLYFGNNVNSIVTLNWQTYSFDNDDHHQSWFAKLLFVVIVIFPVGTCSAAYMFFVRTLGQQIEYWMALNRTLSAKMAPKTMFYLCKVIAFTPPVLGALATNNVKTIVSIAGLLGFFIMMFFPAALQLSSIRTLERLGLEGRTALSGWQSSPAMVYCVSGLGLAGFVYYIYNLATTA
eukprot:TRINITY_DN11512_c0_g2_i1.p1 TRINITY_DN11512_c0_g2~~TRINITY_DN11512_c0_g2_i1.p1  ORF type:complete len:548 (+),score=257.95 TRINITY_DN11512_c0_g2_i1:70-1713(+)